MRRARPAIVKIHVPDLLISECVIVDERGQKPVEIVARSPV
jgi:hypothetical protein